MNRQVTSSSPYRNFSAIRLYWWIERGSKKFCSMTSFQNPNLGPIYVTLIFSTSPNTLAGGDILERSLFVSRILDESKSIFEPDVS